MSKFIYGIFEILEYRNVIFIKDMYISLLITHDYKMIKEEQLKDSDRDKKKDIIDGVDYSLKRLGGGSQSLFHQNYLISTSYFTNSVGPNFRNNNKDKTML